MRGPLRPRRARADPLDHFSGGGEAGGAVQRPARSRCPDGERRQDDEQGRIRRRRASRRASCAVPDRRRRDPSSGNARQMCLARIGLVEQQEERRRGVGGCEGKERRAQQAEHAGADLAAERPGWAGQRERRAHARRPRAEARHSLMARRVVQLRDEAAALVAIELDDDVDDHGEQPLDFVHAQAAACGALADHQRHLLEGEGAAAGVNARDAARMAGGGEPDEVEAFVAPDLGQEDAVRLHAQACLQQRLGRDLGRALCVLAVEEVNDVGMVRQGQLGRVLDRDQPLAPGHLLDQALHEGGLARAGLAADDDGLLLADGEAQEVGVATRGLQFRQLALERRQPPSWLRDDGQPFARTDLRARSRRGGGSGPPACVP